MYFQIYSNIRIGESRRQLVQANDRIRSIVSFLSDTNVQRIGEVCTIVTLLESDYCLIRCFSPSDVHCYLTSLDGSTDPTSKLRPSLQALQDTYDILCDDVSSPHVLIPVRNVNQIEQVAWLGALNETCETDRRYCVLNKYVNTSLLSSTINTLTSYVNDE